MNKLLQYMIGAGNVSDKVLPQLAKAQKGFTSLPIMQNLTKYDNIPNPAAVRANAERLMQFKKAEANRLAAERQGTITQAAPKRSAASKAWAIATNPMTALSYKAKGLDIPENFERGSRNSLDMAVDMVNPFGYANAAATIPGDVASGNIAGAGLKAATLLPFMSEFRGATKGIIPKINPWSYQNNLPQNVMYRGIGKAGMEDALQSGVFRANPNVTPTNIGNFNTTRQFSKAYFSPKFNVADNYGQGFIAEVPRDAATWGNRYKRTDWSQIAQNDIPIDQGRILQKDWLMGYKPVNTSISSSIATEGSKTPFLENVGESLLRGLKKIKPGYVQRKLDQVDRGNDWTREWYSNPIIKERYNNWVEKGSDFANPENALLQLNMNDMLKGSGLSNLPESLAKRYNGTIARDNLDKFLQTGKATKGVLDPLPAINSKVPVGRYSYQSNDALVDVLNSDIYKKGYTVPNTTVHENIHYITRGNLGLTPNSKKFLQRPFNVDPNTGMPLKGIDADDIYLTKPTEVHARIGELRRSFGLRPEQQVDYTMLDKIIEAGKRGETTVKPQWFNLIDNKSDLKWLFNNAPAIAAPVIAGAALSEQKYGGQKMDEGGQTVTNPFWEGKYDFKPINQGTVNNIKSELAGYIQSPLYAKRQAMHPEAYLGNQMNYYEDPKSFQQSVASGKRTYRLMDLYDQPAQIKKIGTFKDYYDPTKRKTVLNSSNLESVVAHELGHSLFKGAPLSTGLHSDYDNSKYWDNLASDKKHTFGTSLNKLEVEKLKNFAYPIANNDEHYDNRGFGDFANESYADLTAMRHLMYKNGLTKKFGDNINRTLYEKALKNKNIQNDPTFKRMQQKYSPGKIILLNNTIAQNENTQPTINMAKQGGPILDPRGQWAHPGKVTRIPSPNITMQGVPYPVMGIGSNGQKQMMQPGQDYNFGGASYVDEYPMMQGGGTAYVDSVLNANKALNWVQRLYPKNTPSMQIPGVKGPSTHFMESGDGRVYPTVVQMPNGSLKYLGKDAFDYADSTKSYIQFPSDAAATWFGKNYKQGTGVLPKNASGGQHGGLDRWFAEKWVDVKSGKACGRQEGENRAYPACRPSKRVSSQTPKTSSEMSPAEKAKFKRTKNSSERIPYNHKK